ncbi:hypothetical protein GJ700_18125 [Duganella sp. FT92W]|uniref:FAD-dependent urate hydroxylase HpyO/Asp monooxygenase CreE-like FAD/NAD(P)-binding domain-containing protein n=1 Tax=Pseudoduganella rivuli TaxID=2666085 RepID=A0A7X2IP66_9BURK|nr:FAD/NAD(P)-binding protein [Pseudoduganella rivuli]MRV73632.1 hypothetical protein [Pseudoduganella rivuli]
MKTILIVGGGFSGAVTAVRLLRRPGGPVHVILANGSGHAARGMAYGTQSPDHTLNVPAGNMSAFDDAPGHFLEFARARVPGIDSGSFVSRKLYGDYLEWLLAQAELQAHPGATLERLYQQVTRVAPEQGGALATLESGAIRRVDKVVLALGHFAARDVRVADMGFYDSGCYLRDPWDESRVNGIGPDDPVLLLGTGLTAVDMAITLLNRNPQRQITAVSRRGLLPQYHRHGSHAPSAGQTPDMIWGDASTVREQLRGFRRYALRLAAEGRDWREGMALLRPVTADIWLAYSERERQRFLRHVQPYWDTHRHRLAPAVADRLDAALKDGVVRAVAGRVRGFDKCGAGVAATVQLRGAERDATILAAWVINCTGPCADPRQARNALVSQLLDDGLVRTDSLGLGLDIGTDCAVIDAAGRASDVMYYIGPWLKANYWEATAVPDLRRYARLLADKLIE